MKFLTHIFLAIILMLPFTSHSYANDEFPDEISFISLQDSYKIRLTITLKVETKILSGSVEEVRFYVSPSLDNEEVKNAQTTQVSSNYYLTTASLYLSQEGKYNIQVAATIKRPNGTITYAQTYEHIQIVDEDGLNLQVFPQKSKLKLGQELPILITYNGKNVKLGYSEDITGEFTVKKGKGYKKVIMIKPTRVGTNYFKVRVIGDPYGALNKEILIEVEK